MSEYSSITSDEIFDKLGSPRPAAVSMMKCLDLLSRSELVERKRATEQLIKRKGVTFTVYSGDGVWIVIGRLI